MSAVHVIISGRVQGVGFRAFVADAASGNGLGGWVRNRRDGTVEAVFSGPDVAVDAMLERCRQGPPSGRVAEVVTTAWSEDVPDAFETWPTA